MTYDCGPALLYKIVPEAIYQFKLLVGQFVSVVHHGYCRDSVGK